MPSVTNAVSSFVTSVIGVFISLFNSVFAVFHAIFALCTDVLSSIVTVGQHFVQMVLELFQGVIGFVAANFIAIALIGGGYYLYTVRNKRRGGIHL